MGSNLGKLKCYKHFRFITDDAVTEKSIVYASVVGKQDLRATVYMPSESHRNPIFNHPSNGVFTAYCAYHDTAPTDGTQLKDIVIAAPS